MVVNYIKTAMAVMVHRNLLIACITVTSDILQLNVLQI